MGANNHDILPEKMLEMDMAAIDLRFNEELRCYEHGVMSVNAMFHLGRPNGIMKMFLPDLPIVMRQGIVRKGIQKKHNVGLDALQNMPSRLFAPVFVFQRNEKTIGILTEMTDRDGKNVCVAIEMNKAIQDGGTILEVNNISSFHGREQRYVVLPIINNHTLRWVDKKKALMWFSSASQPVRQEITSQELLSATKIVKNFENPKVGEQEVKQTQRQGAGLRLRVKSKKNRGLKR